MGLMPVNKKNSKSRKGTKNVTIQSQLDYARNGHTVLRSFLDPARLRAIRKDVMTHVNRQMLDAWRQKVHVASDSPHLAQSCKTIQDCRVQLDQLGIAPDTLPFLQFFNAWRSVESVKTLAFDLGQTASVVLNVPSVRLYQDSVFWKRVGDGPTPWHADARMAPFDTSTMVSFWISLEEVEDKTGLIFCSKSHSDFALPFWNDFDEAEYQRLEDRYRNSTVNYMPLSLGDVTVHSGWTLHCADDNIEGKDRVALAISYVDARAEIREDALEETNSGGGGYGDNEDQWSYKDWVQDVRPRQQFRHALVPIVWPSEIET
jgi:ectoine hydroxylase-related dioxygenase (phytanoyl-CoA dioxygenase family)